MNFKIYFRHLLLLEIISFERIFVVVHRRRAPFGQHQESRPLGESNFLSMCREFVTNSQPIRFDRLDSEHAQSDSKSVDRGISVLVVLDLPRGRDS